MSDLDLVLSDLLAENAELDARLAGLPAESWALATPSAGWTIAHQIAHLHWTDWLAGLSITDPAALAVLIGQAVADPADYVDRAAAEGALVEPAESLRRWRDGRQVLAEQLISVPTGVKLSWFGPPMSPTSMATARLMETWAHGLDVTDTLGHPPVATDRLRHVARLAVRTRDFAFRLHQRPVPVGEFRVELTSPDGASWTFGPPDAEQRVTGPALDLCLLAAQRRNRADLALRAVGPDADAWLDLAQAFAGLPGTGRPATR